MVCTDRLDTDRCFVLTDIRIAGNPSRSAVIDSISGRNLTAITAPRAEPGSSIQLDLGDQGWVDGVVRWSSDGQLGLRLQDDVEDERLFEFEN
jgi:hypothetical protein